MTEQARERKPAAATKAAAARAEVTQDTEQAPEPRTVEYDGLTLTLPEAFPEEIFFDMIESEASAAEGNGGNEYLVNLRLLRSLVGPDQFTDIRHRYGRQPDKVMELVNATLDAFGLTMGESAASPDS